MNMETFTRIIDQLHPYAWHLNLYYLGEPLLCEHLHEMIDYAHQRRMRVATSSNLNILNEKKAEALIESGLDMLVVSLDGASPEVYMKYRIGGDFYRVLHNIQLLIKKKKELGSPTPKILLQFVVFKHNEADIPNIQKLAERLGLELFLRQGALGGEGHSPPLSRNVELAKQWLSQNKAYRKQYDQFSEKPYLSEGACPYLWKMLTVNWDGSVFPCCWVYDEEHIFGNILEQPFEEIWNNECFRSARLLFSRRYSSFLKSGFKFQETICSRCKMYGHFLNT
jgi:radical SAM protein with 4Fe4S-binding SPASM domain